MSSKNWETIFSLFFLFFLFFLFVFAPLYYVPNIGSIYLKPYEYLIVFAVLFVIWLGFFKVYIYSQIKIPRFSIYFLLFILLNLLPIIFVPIKSLGWFLYLSLSLVISFFFWLSLHQFNLESLKEKILLIIVFGGTVQAVIGLLQYFGAFKVLPIPPTESLIYGSFQQKNVFSSFLATGMASAMVLLFLYKQKLVSFYKYFLYFSLILMSTAWFLAFSRAGYIGFILFFIALLLLKKKLAYKVDKIAIISVLLGIAIGFGISKVIPPKLSENPYKFLTEDKVSSNMQRILMYRVSLKMLEENPVFGIGIGNYPAEYAKYQEKVLKEHPELKKYAANAVSHPHNEILKILAESGLFGILSILVLFYGLVKLIRFLWKENPEYLVFLLLLIPIGFHLLVEYPTELSILHKVIFLTIFALASYPYSYTKQVRFRFLYLGLSTGLTVILAILLIETFRAYKGMNEYMINYVKTKTLNIPLIEPALNNVYLHVPAERIFLATALQVVLRKQKLTKDDIKFLMEFVKWSDLTYQQFSSKQILVNEILALMKLGEATGNVEFFDEAMRLAEKGEKIYPNDKTWQKLKSQIVAKTFSKMFERLRNEPAKKTDRSAP